MATTKAILRQWGSSLGVVVPKDVIRQEHFREGEEVVIEIHKKKTLQDVFGSMKDLKIDSQKMKDDLRKEWSKW